MGDRHGRRVAEVSTPGVRGEPILPDNPTFLMQTILRGNSVFIKILLVYRKRQYRENFLFFLEVFIFVKRMLFKNPNKLYYC